MFKTNGLVTIICVSLFIVLISSCVKAHPYITKVKPNNGQVFTAPEIIEISADLYDPDAVDGEYLVVTKENISNDTIINFKNFSFTDGTYHLSNSFTSEPNTTYKIIISASGSNRLIGDTIHVRSN